MIKVAITSKSYGTAQVLGPVAFEVAAGETVALVGPSGIGKSTLLRLISGLDPEFEGTVTKPRAMAFVFQEPTLLPWRSAIDNLRLVHPNLTRDDAEAALEQVGLGEKGSLFPGQLSLGQQRRLSLARAFASTPDLLIMDEPFASLDAQIAQTMIALTKTLITRHRPATLLVTHDLSEAEHLADRILTLAPSGQGAILSHEVAPTA